MILGYRDKKSFWLTYGIILSFGIISFIVRLAKFNIYPIDFQITIFLVSMLVVTVFWESLRFINRTLNILLPFEKGITKRIIVQLVCGAIVGLLIRVLIYTFGEPLLPVKLDSLFLATTWVLYILLGAGINVGFFAGHFMDLWKASIIRAERLEREKTQVQFDNLKNQVNPHFLFNALTSLNSLIHDNQELASQFVQNLSKVYRYVLQHRHHATVSLSTELNFIQHYIFLLQTRFDRALTIQIEIPDTKKETEIVPVTLQIVLENAIKHNTIDPDKPLKIHIFIEEDELVIQNTLQIRDIVENSNRVGLENLRSLYQFLTPRPVRIEKTDDLFSVRIPLI